MVLPNGTCIYRYFRSRLLQHETDYFELLIPNPRWRCDASFPNQDTPTHTVIYSDGVYAEPWMVAVFEFYQVVSLGYPYGKVRHFPGLSILKIVRNLANLANSHKLR